MQESSIYTVEPVRVVDDCIERCDEREAEFWGVYEHQEDGRNMHLEDFLKREDAEMFFYKCHDSFVITGARRHIDAPNP